MNELRSLSKADVVDRLFGSEHITFFKLWTMSQCFCCDDSASDAGRHLTCKTLLSDSSPVRTSTFSRMHFLAVALVYAAADSSRDSVTL